MRGWLVAPVLGVGLSLSASSADWASAQVSPKPGTCELEPGPRRVVVAVPDGGTLKLDDGSELKLAGLRAPQAADSGAPEGAWPPADAARSALEALAMGKPVSLGFRGPHVDRYGRFVAHVFLDDPAGGAPVWLQGSLLASGEARAAFDAWSKGCEPLLAGAERTARHDQKGLWSSPAYAVRSAGHVAELFPFRQTFQLVEGRVESVVEGRFSTYVRLGPDRWRSLTLEMPTRLAHRLNSSGLTVRGLAGHRVLARGIVEMDPAPHIRITTPEALELQDEPGSGGQVAESGPKSPDAPASHP